MRKKTHCDPRRPLFLIPSHLYLRDFARSFAPHRPVYGLEVEAPLTIPIQDEALLHYENLVAFYPEGPYLLAGHSAGGYLALEIARLLMARGKPVGFLGLLDSLPPGPRKQASILDRLRLHLESLRGRNTRGVIDSLSRSVKRGGLRAAQRLLPGRPNFVALADVGEPYWVQRLIEQSYSPEPFPGRVTLFVAAERPWYVRWDPMQRWNRYLTGRSEIVPMEGNHLTSVRPPWASSLARKVEELLP